jgi:chromosomal replication initiator protein
MTELSQAWNKACEYLTEKLGNPAFSTWIQPLKPSAQDGELITLEAPDTFFKDWVEAHHKTIIQEALQIGRASCRERV